MWGMAVLWMQMQIVSCLNREMKITADTFMEVKDESEMDKSEDMSAKGSSDITVEDRSCAANNSYTEGDRSDAEGNGEGNRMVETG